MKKYFLQFLFILNAFALCAQNHRHIVDSIRAQLPSMPDDTNKVKAILKLCDQTSYYDEVAERDFAMMGLDLAKRIGNLRGQGAFNNVIGIFYEQHGDFQNALRYYLESQKFNEAANNKRGQAMSVMNSGNVFYRMKDYKQSLKSHKEALSLFTLAKSVKGQSDCYMNIGNDYSALGNYDSSMYYYDLSLKIREKIGDKKGIAQTLNNLGEEALSHHELDLAREYLTRSRAIKTELADTNGLSNTYLELSSYYYNMKQFRKALECCDSGLYFANHAGNADTRMSIYKQKSLVFEAMNDNVHALEFHKLFSDLKDSIFTLESTNGISRMQTLYETEKKEKENELLKERNKIATLESGRKDEEISKQRNYIIAAVIGLLLMIALALFILKGYRDKQKAHRIILAQKKEVEFQKELVDEKQKEILDSITYAKRIQGALLASDNLLGRNLPEYFVFYKPKDIVSGDFYWASALPNGRFLLLTGDCTGHGVPGAFMSLLMITLLNKIVNEHRISQPDDVLNEVRRDIINSLNREEESDKTAYDGMDCSLISFDLKNSKMSLAAAMNPVIVVRNTGAIELLPDKQPVGYTTEMKDFKLQQFELQKGDMIYAFTDGYADQFGGEKGKKFRYSRLKDMLVRISGEDAGKQKEILEKELKNWQGNLFQVDDVLVIGVRV